MITLEIKAAPGSGKCMICGRSISADKSKERGIGPKCYRSTRTKLEEALGFREPYVHVTDERQVTIDEVLEGESADSKL